MLNHVQREAPLGALHHQECLLLLGKEASNQIATLHDDGDKQSFQEVLNPGHFDLDSTPWNA